MFSLFKKKRNIDDLPLIFKSNVHAFRYACKYCNTSFTNNNPVMGIVVYREFGTHYWIKLSNPEDDSAPCSKAEIARIPPEQRKHICMATDISRHLVLESADLVMVVAPDGLSEVYGQQIGGIIVAKIKPEFSMKHQGWKRADA